MERSILYVSRQSLAIIEPEQTIAEIVDRARLHNASVGITGSLACVQDYFAQLVEGPGPAVDDLLHRLDKDPRHTDLTVLRVEAITSRRLPGWSMAYSGKSNYVARQIVPLLGEAIGGNALRVERLISLLVGFAIPARS